MSFDVTALAPADLDDLVALFAANGSTCFCRYWHFEGNKNEWLDRCAHRPEENEHELREATTTGVPSARGLVARRSSDRVLVGWMKLAPKGALPKLTNLAVYRSLSLGGHDEVLSVGCFLVHPEERKHGVATALLRGAEAYARDVGARSLEGYPRRSEAPLYDEEAWQGPEALFRQLGFTAVHDVGPYPVYRKVLA